MPVDGRPSRGAVCALAIAVACCLPAPARARQAADEAAVTPFRIDVPEAVLADLQARLAATRLPDELEDADWDYGVSLPYLRELVGYWRDEFDWRAQERRLNAFDQFRTTMPGYGFSDKPREGGFDTGGWPGSGRR